jgi:hypothetical protein
MTFLAIVALAAVLYLVFDDDDRDWPSPLGA